MKYNISRYLAEARKDERTISKPNWDYSYFIVQKYKNNTLRVKVAPEYNDSTTDIIEKFVSGLIFLQEPCPQTIKELEDYDGLFKEFSEKLVEDEVDIDEITKLYDENVKTFSPRNRKQKSSNVESSKDYPDYDEVSIEETPSNNDVLNMNVKHDYPKYEDVPSSVSDDDMDYDMDLTDDDDKILSNKSFNDYRRSYYDRNEKIISHSLTPDELHTAYQRILDDPDASDEEKRIIKYALQRLGAEALETLEKYLNDSHYATKQLAIASYRNFLSKKFRNMAVGTKLYFDEKLGINAYGIGTYFAVCVINAASTVLKYSVYACINPIPNVMLNSPGNADRNKNSDTYKSKLYNEFVYEYDEDSNKYKPASNFYTDEEIKGVYYTNKLASVNNGPAKACINFVPVKGLEFISDKWYLPTFMELHKATPHLRRYLNAKDLCWTSSVANKITTFAINLSNNEVEEITDRTARAQVIPFIKF